MKLRVCFQLSLLLITLAHCGGSASDSSGPHDAGASGAAGATNEPDAGRFACGDITCAMNQACGFTPCCVSVGCTSHYACAEITGAVLAGCTAPDGGLKSPCKLDCLP